MRIDAHQHFWVYDPAEHVWMTDEMASLRTLFLPGDLEPLLASAGFAGCVAVQARQKLVETEWLLGLARAHPIIKAVVGWVDLRSPAVDEQLARFAADPMLRGVRHVVHDEPDDAFLSQPDFRRGIAALRRHGLTYDILIMPRHLPYAVDLVRAFPEQPFVLDHIAKPDIKRGALEPWRTELRRLAAHPNVSCKLSGMVTEADWQHWAPADFVPYLDAVVEAFGPERVMVGSDWPVCTVAGSYESVMGIVLSYVGRFSPSERDAILGGTCARFYGIESG